LRLGRVVSSEGVGTMASGQDRPGLISVKVAGFYLLAAVVWIPLSDAVIERLADGPAELSRLQTIKGWAFVLLTSILLYVLIRQALRSRSSSDASLQYANAQLEMILNSLPVILWTADSDLVVTSSRGKGLAEVGRKPNQDVGRNLREVISDMAVSTPLVGAAEAAVKGKTVNYMVEQEGTHYESTIAPLLSESGDQVGIVSFTIDITERQALLEQLRRLVADRERLLKHLVRAETDERERIASGIHDDSIQVITSAAMGLDLLIQRLDDEESVAMAERSRAAMGEAIARLRRLVFDLKPVDLDRYGLATALRSVLEQFHAHADFDYEVPERIIRGLDPRVRYDMFRIAREAIINACKHSSPSMIRVAITEESEGARVCIQDDGTGFDPSSVGTDRRHFGLVEMSQRAELAGGWFRVSSEIGKGTTVEFWMPLVEDPEVDAARSGSK
jgi:signal transduction histidine kinase